MTHKTARYLADEAVRFEYEIPKGTVAELTLPNGERHTLCTCLRLDAALCVFM